MKSQHQSVTLKVWYVLAFSAMACTGPFMNLYYHRIDFTESQIGILAAVQPWGRIAGGPTVASLADITGYHRLVFLVLFLAAGFVRSFFGLISSFIVFVAAILFVSIFYSPVMVLTDAVSLSAAERGIGTYGGRRLYGAVGWGISAAAIGYVIQQYGIYSIFIANIILTLVAFPVGACIDFGHLSSAGGVTCSTPGSQIDSGISPTGAIWQDCQHLDPPENRRSSEHENGDYLQPTNGVGRSHGSSGHSQQQRYSNGLSSTQSTTALGTQTSLGNSGSYISADSDYYSVADGASEASFSFDRSESSSTINNSDNKFSYTVESSQVLGSQQQQLAGGSPLHQSPHNSNRLLQINTQLQNNNNNSGRQLGQHGVRSGSFSTRAKIASQQFGEMVSQPLVVLFFGVVIMMGLAQGTIESYLFLYLDYMKAPEGLLGLLITATCVGEVPVFFFGHKIISSLGVHGTYHMVFVVYLIRILAYITMHKWPTVWLVLPVELLHGITYGAANVACSATSQQVAPKGLESTVLAVFKGLQYGLGVGLGGLVGGQIYQRKGPRMVFMILFLVMTAAWASYILALVGLKCSTMFKRRNSASGTADLNRGLLTADID